MNVQWQSNERQAFLLLCMLMLAIGVYKWPYLSLPFFWDEAWSYARAVFTMHKQGITLWPGSVDPEIFRGHPLFFYASSAAMSSLGEWNLTFMHGSMLAIAMLLCITTYFALRSLLGWQASWLSMILLLMQNLFLVQCSFLLPEIQIGFLSIISLSAYLKQQKVVYLLASCVLVITKESGIIAPLAIICYEAISYLRHRNRHGIFSLQSLVWIFPLLLFAAFLGVQKYYHGWFLFPEHAAMLRFNGKMVWEQMLNFVQYLGVQDARRPATILVAISLPLLAMLRRKSFLLWMQNPWLHLLLLFTVLYLVFSAINFFSTRYLFALLIVWSCVCGSIVSSWIDNNRLLMVIAAIFAMYFIPYFFIVPANANSEASRDYVCSVQTQYNVIREFVCTHAQQEIDSHQTIRGFYGDFLLNENMSHPEIGYLATGCVVPLQKLSAARYILSSNIEPVESRIQNELNKGTIRLVFERKQKSAWCRVYERQ